MKKIENIYAYCDRWCERCGFGARCQAYAARKEIRHPENLEADDEKNRIFWERLENEATEVQNKIKLKAAQKNIDLTEFEGVSTKAKFDLFQHKLVNNMVLKAGRLYEDKVDDFLDDMAGAGRIVMDEFQPGSVFKIIADDLPETSKEEANTMLDIIMRYQLNLYLKLSRAYYSKGREEENGLSVDKGSRESDGTAKVSLALINLSLVAWYHLQHFFPDQTTAINEIMYLLMRIKYHLETEFPHASTFIRPGFDEP